MTLLDTIIESSRERRMYRGLLQLNDHLLRDIGFNRYALREDLAARRRPSINTLL